MVRDIAWDIVYTAQGLCSVKWISDECSKESVERGYGQYIHVQLTWHSIFFINHDHPSIRYLASTREALAAPDPNLVDKCCCARKSYLHPVGDPITSSWYHYINGRCSNGECRYMNRVIRSGQGNQPQLTTGESPISSIYLSYDLMIHPQDEQHRPEFQALPALKPTSCLAQGNYCNWPLHDEQ